MAKDDKDDLEGEHVGGEPFNNFIHSDPKNPILKALAFVSLKPMAYIADRYNEFNERVANKEFSEATAAKSLDFFKRHQEGLQAFGAVTDMGRTVADTVSNTAAMIKSVADAATLYATGAAIITGGDTLPLVAESVSVSVPLGVASATAGLAEGVLRELYAGYLAIDSKLGHGSKRAALNQFKQSNTDMGSNVISAAFSAKDTWMSMTDPSGAISESISQSERTIARGQAFIAFVPTVSERLTEIEAYVQDAFRIKQIAQTFAGTLTVLETGREFLLSLLGFIGDLKSIGKLGVGEAKALSEFGKLEFRIVSKAVRKLGAGSAVFVKENLKKIVQFTQTHAKEGVDFLLNLPDTIAQKLVMDPAAKVWDAFKDTKTGKFVSGINDKFYAFLAPHVAGKLTAVYDSPAGMAMGQALKQGADLFDDLSIFPVIGAPFGVAKTAAMSCYAAYEATGTIDGSVPSSLPLTIVQGSVGDLVKLAIANITGEQIKKFFGPEGSAKLSNIKARIVAVSKIFSSVFENVDTASTVAAIVRRWKADLQTVLSVFDALKAFGPGLGHVIKGAIGGTAHFGSELNHSVRGLMSFGLASAKEFAFNISRKPTQLLHQSPTVLDNSKAAPLMRNADAEIGVADINHRDKVHSLWLVPPPPITADKDTANKNGKALGKGDPFSTEANSIRRFDVVGGGAPSFDAQSLHHLLTSSDSGFSPDARVRQSLAGDLGFDPSGARLHNSPLAAAAARDLNAQAFTIGGDVFFGGGRYDPWSRQGMSLIAHELTHVGQQTGTIGDKARFFSASGGDAMEREAQEAGSRVLARHEETGFTVEQYVRIYEPDGAPLTHEDQQRLDRISLMALEEAERILMRSGGRSAKALDINLSVNIDLSSMSDGQAADIWAKAIIDHIKSDTSYLGSTDRQSGSQLSLIDQSIKDFRQLSSVLDTGPSKPSLQPISSLSLSDKIALAIDRSAPKIGPTVYAMVKDPWFYGPLIALAGGAIALQFTPAGWVADSLALALGAAEGAMNLQIYYQITKDLIKFGKECYQAKTEEDIDLAADEFAELAAIGATALASAGLGKTADIAGSKLRGPKLTGEDFAADSPDSSHADLDTADTATSSPATPSPILDSVADPAASSTVPPPDGPLKASIGDQLKFKSRQAEVNSGELNESYNKAVKEASEAAKRHDYRLADKKMKLAKSIERTAQRRLKASIERTKALQKLLPEGQIATPFGIVQDSGDPAIIDGMRRDLLAGKPIYRQVVIGTSRAGEGQRWSPKKPWERGMDGFGLPGNNTNPDMMIRGSLEGAKPTDFAIQPAPAIGKNVGGEYEIVTKDGAVKLTGSWSSLRSDPEKQWTGSTSKPK